MLKIIKMKNFIFIFFGFLIINSNTQILLGNEFKSEIVAIVNGSPITSFDIDERLNIFLFESDLEKNELNEKKFFKDILNSLIEDELKIQEALKINPDIYKRAEEKARKMIENNFGPGEEKIKKNLMSYGASIQHMNKFFATDLLWTSIIKSKFEREFETINEKVEKKLKALNLNLMKTNYKLSEIEISANNNRDIKETKNMLDKVIEGIEKGANFYSVAKRFSSAESKINNGRLGWVSKESLSEDITNIIEKTEVGEISQPIKINETYKIFRVEGKIINGQRDEKENVLELTKLIYPIGSINESDTLKIKNKIDNDLKKIANCDDLKSLHLEYGNQNKAEEASIQIFNLSNIIKREVMHLSKNEFTEPILSNDGYVVLMVCKKYLPEIKLPSKDKLKKVVENELLFELSERYINRLKSYSYIEIKK